MKKIIRLTESDLKKLVKRVLAEQEDIPGLQKFDKYFVWLQEADSETVKYILSQLPSTVRFIALRDCEFADFSDIDLCSYSDVMTINLEGTPNNFLDNVNCEVEDMGKGVFAFIKEDEE